MNIELEMLKLQLESFRSNFFDLLPIIFAHDKQNKKDGSKPWYFKYYLWHSERESLSALADRTELTSSETARIDRRCFQLQVLMDVAYIQGGLEGYDIHRLILPNDRDIADRVFYNSDGSEEDMVRVIDSMF